MLGQTGMTGAIGVYGYSSNAAAYAGYFVGKVTVAGDFAVTGSKSALVAHQDGTHRTVYCVEAPEAWLEEFGEATVVGGQAAVTLDPEFMALIDPGQMHIFLSAQYAEGHGLAATTRSATGFTVVEHNNGTSSGKISYRVVGRRKDKPGERLAKVTLPPPVVPVPEPHEPPKVTLPKVRTKA